MIGGVRGSYVSAILVATAALVLVVLVVEVPLIEARENERTKEALWRVAASVVEALAAGAEPDGVADRVGARTGTHVRIFGTDGITRGDTALDGTGLGSVRPLTRDAKDIDDALKLGKGFVVARDPRTQRFYAYASLEAPDGALVRVSRPADAQRIATDAARELVLVGGIATVALAGLLTILLSRMMLQPIRELSRVADALATGDLADRARIQRTDELGALGRAVDRMADQLTERLRTLRAEEARLRTVLDAMREAVFVTDARGRIVLTNQSLSKLARSAVRGRTAVETIRSPGLHQAVAGALRGDSASVEIEVRVADELRNFAAEVAPLPERAGVVAVLHDVTNLKRIDQVRRDFVANASHELRTPLTAIRGFAETLRDGALEQPDAASRFLELILKHTIRLQRLVDDLLALSSAESPDTSYEISTVDVEAVARNVLRDLGAQGEERGLVLELEPTTYVPPARGNERALDQILVNLVDNAIKYTPAGGRVVLRIDHDEELVHVHVIDSGPGIPAQYQERIFERFYRVDKGRSRQVGGTGLGLAIVKHLATRMKADVGVASRPGLGSTFTVSMRRSTVNDP